MSRQERAARRQRIAARRAEHVIAKATEAVIAKTESPAPSSPQDQAAEVKRLRDEGTAWWVIGQKLGLAGAASNASEPEAKRGAGAARRLYAAFNRGEVPRTHAPRKGSTPKPSGPASRGVPDYMRKQQLVDEGHVIPRDMPDEEVAAMLLGRRIEWAIDMARLTHSDPDTWGRERWVKQEARVHVLPECVWVGMLDGCPKRVVKFREYAGFDTDRNKHMSGPTRVVMVDSIYTVA